MHPVIGFTSLLCIAVGAGASGALNMWYDRDIDALMTRTANRPIPPGRITPSEALAFGLTLSFFSVMTLGMLVNWFAGGAARLHDLLLCRHLHDVAEALDARRTSSSAAPPARCRRSSAGPRRRARSRSSRCSCSLIIFLWTPPHFWALALYRTDDFVARRLPMLPVVAGPDATRLQILLYTIVLVAVGVAPWPLGYFGAPMALSRWSSARRCSGSPFRSTGAAKARPREAAARSLFAFSILYLFVLFATLLVEALAPLRVRLVG